MKSLVIFLVVNAFLITEIENKPTSSRVIGGQPAPVSQYYFIAAIYVEKASGRYFCGGALHKNQWIITAAQCVDGGTLFTVNLGSVKLTGPDPNRLTVATSEYVIHPDYNPLTLDNDIGLIKIRMPIQETDLYIYFIKPIYPLALTPLGNTNTVRIVGWGQTSDTNSSLSEELQVIKGIPVSNDECRRTYGNQVTDNMVCVFRGACHGDTGSPLLDSYIRYTAIHVGIASFVSGNGCESRDPSGFTRTYPYVQWINEITV